MPPIDSPMLRPHWPSRHPLLTAITVVLTPCLWILFVATLNPHELIAGLICSIATLVFTVFVFRMCSSNLQFRLRDLVQAWRIPWNILSDACTITIVLVKHLLRLEPAGNLYRVCGFDTSAHDPVRKARTVLAVAYATATPNAIAIGIDPALSRMLFHQLKRTPVPKAIQSLGAKS